MCGRSEVVPVLIQNGANVNAMNNEVCSQSPTNIQTTPHLIMYPVQLIVGHRITNYSNCCTTTIAMNTQKQQKRAPLHWAVLNEHRDCVEVLMKNHANVNAQDQWVWVCVFGTSIIFLFCEQIF